MIRTIGINSVAQIVVMISSGGLGFVITRLIVGEFGVDTFAQYGLLTSMAALVPFADLGLSAAVINALASSSNPAKDDLVRSTILSAFRVLIVSALIFSSISIALALTGAWPAILGSGLLVHGGMAASLCVLVFSITLPLGVGQRILTGLGKNHLQVVVQAIGPPSALVGLLAIAAWGRDPGSYLAVAPYVSASIVAAVCLRLAAVRVRPQVSRAMHDIHRLRSVRGAGVMNVAWPMLIQMLALPLAMQSDRLLLSHLAPTIELARYNLTSQYFGLILQTIGVAGVALWPVYARARANESITSPFPLMWTFLAAGLAVGGIFASLFPWAASILSDGRIHVTGMLIGGFVTFVAVEAMKYPLGIYMTDARGLRFQVIPVLLMVPANLALSWLLVSPLGAAGPIIGSAVSVALFQVAPYAWYVRRDLGRRSRYINR